MRAEDLTLEMSSLTLSSRDVTFKQSLYDTCMSKIVLQPFNYLLQKRMLQMNDWSHFILGVSLTIMDCQRNVMHNVLIVLYCKTLAAIAMGYGVKSGTGIG